MEAIKLANFVNAELSSELKEIIFTKDNSGKYYLFGKYVILSNKRTYVVYCLKNGYKLEFCNLKNATAWCILDNVGKHLDARRIETLDLRLSSIEVDIAVHKNKIKHSKNNLSASISMTKLQQDTLKRKIIVSELSDYIDNSKQIQYKNFRTKDSKIKHLR